MLRFESPHIAKYVWRRFTQLAKSSRHPGFAGPGIWCIDLESQQALRHHDIESSYNTNVSILFIF